MLNPYELKARKFPAIITMLPILLFFHFYFYKIIPELLDSILFTKIFGDISIVLVLLFFVEQISRFISKKFLQDNLFQDELHFPTTNFLLYSDQTYTLERKEKIRIKIKKDFNINLLKAVEEKNDENEARKRIKEAVDLIRNKVKDGRLLLQHNIEYGFVRNLIGGLVILLPFSFFTSIFFMFEKNNLAMVLSIFLFLFFSIIFLNKKSILIYFAHNYANILYNEYLP
ncbi:MAG: hypothetical protein KKI14_04130 [Nanoarchaeota archaeon]|nr:hypothetical protein [Nanoarchaeota archaeon]